MFFCLFLILFDYFIIGTCSDYPSDAPEPHSTAKEMNIYELFESKHAHMTTSSIVKRILENQIQYEARNMKKADGLLQILEQQKQSWYNRTTPTTNIYKN